jgi:UDP-galactopyranose mutase
MWQVTTPDEAKAIIQQQSDEIGEPTNLEEQAIKFVGKDVYNKLIKGYTEKQWRKPCNELPKEIIKRLPVRFTYDNNYFNDTYQGIPSNGYTELFEKLLVGIDTKLNSDYFESREYFDSLSNNIIYTGPVDQFYGYKHGILEYRTLDFDSHVLENENFQGHSVVNYTSSDVPYTRILEHKHFTSSKSTKTVITYEYSKNWKLGDEPYYPVNDEKNDGIFKLYKQEMEKETNIYFGGRLGRYRYYDMHQVVASALSFSKKLKEELKR